MHLALDMNFAPVGSPLVNFSIGDGGDCLQSVDMRSSIAWPTAWQHWLTDLPDMISRMAMRGQLTGRAHDSVSGQASANVLACSSIYLQSTSISLQSR